MGLYIGIISTLDDSFCSMLVIQLKWADNRNKEQVCLASKINQILVESNPR